MTEDKDLEQRVVLGLDTEAFLGSNVGRYIVQRAQEEIDEARESLETVDPENAKAVRDLQFVIGVARATVQWMKEAVADGQNAAEEMVRQASTD